MKDWSLKVAPNHAAFIQKLPFYCWIPWFLKAIPIWAFPKHRCTLAPPGINCESPEMDGMRVDLRNNPCT